MTIAIPSDTTRIFIDRARFVQAMSATTLQRHLNCAAGEAPPAALPLLASSSEMPASRPKHARCQTDK